MSDEITRADEPTPPVVETDPHVALAKYMASPGYAMYLRLVLAIMSSIPWVGSLIGASAALSAEKEQGRVNSLLYQWLEEHEFRYKRLESTVTQMIERIDELGPAAKERVQEEGYLGLVRRGFRVWDEASTDEKRDFVRRTLTHAAGTRICSDDVVRLFLQWIEQYDELHFRVIRVIYKMPGATRADMWAEIHGEDVREDSAEADLFKMIISDLSTGHVIRQERATTAGGQFLARAPVRRQRRSRVLTSAFDDEKPYELTEIGGQFVHYALDEVIPRLAASDSKSGV